MSDLRFQLDDHFIEQSEAESSKAGASRPRSTKDDSAFHDGGGFGAEGSDRSAQREDSDGRQGIDAEIKPDGLGEGMDEDGFAGPKVVKPLTAESLATFKAAQDKAGVIYISRIPPGMRPTKVRHIMSQYGEIGRVYLQQEDAKRAYLRKKYTSTKKAHYTEGWVEFKDKKIARSVAEMLNAQPIGGKKGTRWRDDVWTMKYLPKFKWNMLTEQVAHEAAVHAARLRVELSQSRTEQQEYLKNVELARVLDKRAERKRAAGKDDKLSDVRMAKKRPAEEKTGQQQLPSKRRKAHSARGGKEHEGLGAVLRSVF